MSRTELRTPRVSTAPVATRRLDLDGLRALAVLLVAVYHIWVYRVSGGVDVFLLLSGFFVGGSVLRACLRGDFRARRFLARTARRLLPTLVVVVGVVVLVTVVVLPINTWSEVARQALASLLYAENTYLSSAGREYGAVGVVDSPFQHVWSMSVQGQIFLALALVAAFAVMLMRRRGEIPGLRAAAWAVGLACAASFAWACVLVVLDQPAAYFATAARAWEFLLGTLLAILVRSRAGAALEAAAHRVGLGPVLAWTGIAAILLTGVLVDGANEFPGPVTLLPLVGAALVVVFWRGRWAPARLLESRAVSAAGGYAYAFYLWHWPILVFTVQLREREDVGWLAGAGVLLLSAVLAWATKRFVEDRFRTAVLSTPGAVRRHGLRVDAVVVALAVALALPAGWLVRVEAGRSQLGELGQDLERYPGAAAVAFPDLFSWNAQDGIIPSLALASEDKPRAVSDGCNAVEDEVVVCSYGDLDADRVLVVVGGSHTEQWADAVAMVGEESGFRVDTMIKWTCELVDGSEGVEFFDNTCRSWGANVLAELEVSRPDAVFTTWTRPADDSASHEVVPVAYERAWDRLARAGISAVVIRDNPWTGQDPVGCLADAAIDDEECGIARVDVLDDNPPPPASGGDFVHTLDLTDVLCPDDWCPFSQSGRIVYRDDHHLTNSFAISASPVLQDRILPLLGWDA